MGSDSKLRYEIIVKKCIRDRLLPMLIQYIYNHGVPTRRYEIAHILGTHERRAFELLRFLREYTAVRAFPNIASLGLYRVYIVVSRALKPENIPLKEWLYAYARLIVPHNGTLISYYVPNTLDPFEIEVLFKEILGSYEYMFIAYDTIFPRLEYRDDKFIFRINESIWDSQQASLQKPFDYIDLLIIKELEKNALLKINELCKRIGVHKGCLIKHFIGHVKKRDLIKKYIPLFLVDNPHSFVSILLFLENRGNSGKKLFTISSKTLFYIYIGIDDTLALFTRTNLSNVISFLKKIGSQYYRIYAIDPSTIVKYTIPYNMYDHKCKSWKPINVF